MKITVTHTRAVVGTDIQVSVQAEGKESLTYVEVTLDGDTLDTTDLDPGTESYQRDFPGVGQAGPGRDHTLVVTAESADGKPHTSVTRWTDAI